MANTQQKTDVPVQAPHYDEEILAVPRTLLFADHAWHGLMCENAEQLISHIVRHSVFLPRQKLETDTNYKQIIPYLVFSHQDELFLMRRRKTSSERRLQSLYSFGIGGHTRREDVTSESPCQWGMREFNEEVCYAGTYKERLLGLINDDTNDVGQVHLGVVYLLEGNSKDIAIRDEHAEGSLLSIAECGFFYDKMETWSRIVYDALTSKKEDS